MVPVPAENSPRPESRAPATVTAGRETGLLLVKVGGGLLALPGALARVGQALGRLARERAVAVVPGGGPFADAVRQFDDQHGLSPTAAHWMAILGMDQYAFAIADHVPSARVVEDRAGILSALAEGHVPILAPSRWLRAADELPHSWEVTSDALAAYLATLLGAEALVLIKPTDEGTELVDPYFRRVLAAGLRWRVVSAGDAALEAVLRG